MKNNSRINIAGALMVLAVSMATTACKPKKASNVVGGDAAEKVYVAPGKYDEVYLFASGGFSGQIGVYGIPSGRLFREIPVFSMKPESGYGFSEETKALLMSSKGFIPWDDTHHPVLSKNGGNADGKWLFINANNTPRIARIDLKTFRTVETIELPNTGGNHASPYCTENTEYIVGASRFSVPSDEVDVPINTYKKNFKGVVNFIKIDKESGNMNLAFQIDVPAINYDLARGGKGVSKDWVFFSSYNSEQANTLLEVNASQKDKDFILAVNWKKAEEYLAQNKGVKKPANYYHNLFNENTHTATSQIMKEVMTLDARTLKGICYYMPCPKSPHGCDVSPTGEYIVASGKLAATIPVFSFKKMVAAIEKNDVEGEFDGIPVLKYASVIAGEVEKPGLGPLHTEFDNKGFAYTSFFVSSEVVKWNVETRQVVDRIPTYYSIGHLCAVQGDSKDPFGKYLVALNKITKDRYLPTGPELCQSAQLIDISGEKMKLLLDFPTIGEPHYAQMIQAELLVKNQRKVYKLEENKHPFFTPNEKAAKVERKGNEIHVYMTSIRSHFTPDNIEGVKVGDDVYFHVTNLEQDWDVPHGFAVKGAGNSELLIMPGETQTLKWTPKTAGMYPMYCTDFCSALHQEMQGYVRVSPAGSNIPLNFSTGTNNGESGK